MGNVYKLAEPGMRIRAEYKEAASLFEEKRQAMARVAEIDRTLRKLSKEEPHAVEAARQEITFRKGHGRKTRGEKAVAACTPIAALPINTTDSTA